MSRDSAEASVVVLPLPVGPVTMIMPCGASRCEVEHLAVAIGEAEAGEIEQALIALEHAQDRRFAVRGRHGGDAEVELGARP